MAAYDKDKLAEAMAAYRKFQASPTGQAQAIAAGKSPVASAIRDDAGSSDANSLYNEIFGRDIDQAGADFYAGKGYSNDQLRDVLMASAEREYFNDARNPDVDRAFNAMLGRNAGQEGEEFYRDYTYDEIIGAIRGEQDDIKWAGDPMSEYERHFAGADAEGYRGGDNRNLHTESDYGAFRNPNTNPFTEEEEEALREELQGDRQEWDTVKPWFDSEILGNNAFQQGGGVQGVAPSYKSTFQRQQTSGDMSNQELYDIQFSNLVGQQNDFQNQQQQAQLIRQLNADKPPSGPPTDPWSWYNEGKGLPDRSGAPGGAPPGGAPPPTANTQLTPAQQQAIAASIGNINIGI